MNAREVVTKNLRRGNVQLAQDKLLMQYVKSLRNQGQTRRYSIAATSDGWEVREERDSKVVRTEHYRDWHRVERKRRSIAMELAALRDNGWREEEVKN